MLRRNFLIFSFIFQFLVSNKFTDYVAAKEVEYFNNVEPEPFDYVAALEAELNNRLPESSGYEVTEDEFDYPPSEIHNPVNLAEGIGEVFVHGNDICTDGITEIEGSVPITGSVKFGGPVRACGTVTIAGRCAPASGSSLRIGQPLRLRKPLIPPSPVKAPLGIPAPVQEILPPEPDPVPIITLPPVVIPALVVPAYVLPEVVIPASKFYELVTGFGNVMVTGNDVLVNGVTYVDGAVPMIGDVTFSGYVPAKGKVTICGCF